MDRYKCGYCRKIVRDKPFLGTLHICLSPGDRTEVDYYRWVMEQQKRMNAEHEQNVKTCMGYLDSRPRA